MARPARVSPDRILTAAAAEFAARGYAGARVDRIARRARVNKAMLYYHFRSKQSLYRTLLRTVFSGVSERLQAVVRSSDPPDRKLERVIDEMSSFIHEHAFFPAIMLREVADGGAHLDRGTLDALAAVPRAAAQIIHEGMAAGAFRRVDPMAAYFSMLPPLVFFMAAAPIRSRLATPGRLDGAALTRDAFVAHVQATMRRALTVEADS